MQLTIEKKQKISKGSEKQPAFPLETEELIAQCPGCKTIETIFFSNGELISTRKFYSKDTHVFHKCSTNEPCRLYRNV
jgi:hypothetical protein